MTTGRQAAALACAAVMMPFVLAAGVAFAAEGSGAISPASAAATPPCISKASGAGPADGLDGSQVANAQIIYDVATGMGLPQQAAIIAIATAMQESTLRNLDYGDRDSLGLFQQRPSQGWGTPTQIMQPVYATTAFYHALVRVPDWQGLPLTVAAQDVQHSGYPDAYAQWQPLATALVARFTANTGTCVPADNIGVPASGTTQLPTGFTLPPGTPQQVQVAISYALAQLGKPYIWGGTGPTGYDCSGLVMMAYRAAGVDLPRTTYQQVDVGTPVYSVSQLQPGDLLFTAGSDGTANNPGHVGMYIGSGTVVQAPQTGEDVMLTPLAGYWATSTVAIRRIVEGSTPLRADPHRHYPRTLPRPPTKERTGMKDNTSSLIAVRLLSKTSPDLAIAAIGPWAARARCADEDPEIFFPPGDDPATEARQICSQCPVRDECLAYALDAGEQYGIWGGLDPAERRALRRRLKARRPDAAEGAA